ncbi:MAG TPA: FAD-linked oxidase C-terminal domain-containing protein [Chloroflexota bacterium]|jgi:glycolate oxidase|nr:FAD-linked oxidase C-terminal domain-containing protein [Chloroflexota bacterium]
MQHTEIVTALERIVGKDGVVSRADELLVYEYDGSLDTHLPTVVVFPQTTAQVAQVVQLANQAGLPVVPRGAGTGLSGGAVAACGGIIVATTRMNRILAIDYANRRAVVQPGVINYELTHQIEHEGYFYAPDPSSQKVCTIGGNVAENSGGPHCLSYGATTNHILDLELVLPDGQIVHTAGPGGEQQGLDLTGAVVGSEGTFGIATEITVKLTRMPEDIRVLLAIFGSIEEASSTVSAIIGAGIVPAALEMMDGLCCRAVEAAYHAGYPPDAGAVLLVELDGLREAVAELDGRIQAIFRQHGAREVRSAGSAAERAALWAGRKGALGALGRLAPNYYIQDGVVPRTKLPETLRFVEEVARDIALPIANVFHAGDGNLHPNILFDRRDRSSVERTLRGGMEILRHCVDQGGVVSGEHGIGLEKRDHISYLFTTEDLAAMARLKQCFNPRALFNPDKIFPPLRGCGEVRDQRVAARLAQEGIYAC